MLGFLLCFQVLFSLGSSFDGFEKNCLQATNQLRRRHGVPDLTWSNALAADAQAWANKLANSNTFEHDYNSMQAKSQGENLAYFKPYKKKCQGQQRADCVQCREIVDDWYDEVKNYDFGLGKSRTPNGVVMHFTQEVWKNSRQFGIGTAKSKKYGFILVARYSPRGNRGGPVIFKDNVFPPGTISDPTPSTNPSAAPPTTGPPTSTASSFSVTQNISINITYNNATRPTTAPSSAQVTENGVTQNNPINITNNNGTRPTTAPSRAPTTEGGSSTTPPPSATIPSTGLPTTTSPQNVTTTAAPQATTAPSGPGKNKTGKCEYFVVNSTTYTYAIVQKCKGKPNITFIPQGENSRGSPTGAASVPGTPTPTSATRPPNAPVPPTTPPPKPCQPNPCKNGATCEPGEGNNFTCTCPNGYSGPLCQERGPSEEEIKDALMLTNMYRAIHQAPEVTWSKEMAAKAQDWADKLAKEQRLVHENESSADYGENLAEVGSDDKALLRAIDAWYNEVANYNFQEPKFTTDTGHFSQLVWGPTNQLGMAKAQARDMSNVYVVARYKPPGNVVGQFQSNVKPKQ